MIGKRFRSLPFIFANDNYTLRFPDFVSFLPPVPGKKNCFLVLTCAIIFMQVSIAGISWKYMGGFQP